MVDLNLLNGKLYQESEFPKSYTKIVYLANSDINWDTNNNIIFRLFNDENKDKSNIYRINYWMELMEEKYQYLFYQCEKILIPNNEFKKLFPKDLDNIIHCYKEDIYLPKNINQYIISNKIKHVEYMYWKIR